MKLDKRINKIAIIYDCFDSENARESIGEKGYFSHFKSYFSDLSKCKLGVLQDVIDGEHPYDNGKILYEFFLPDRYIVENKEKTYRPYTMREFQKIFMPGLPIRFRRKENKLEKLLVLIGYETVSSGKVFIQIGSYDFTLEDLFNGYEWQERETEDYKPFGVEE